MLQYSDVYMYQPMMCYVLLNDSWLIWDYDNTINVDNKKDMINSKINLVQVYLRQI